jgi:hypothetical protein
MDCLILLVMNLSVRILNHIINQSPKTRHLCGRNTSYMKTPHPFSVPCAGNMEVENVVHLSCSFPIEDRGLPIQNFFLGWGVGVLDKLNWCWFQAPQSQCTSCGIAFAQDLLCRIPWAWDGQA